MIKFEISSEIVEVAPNNVSQVSLSVTNTSQIIDFFTVTVEPVISPETMGLYPGWVEFNTPTFSLRPAGDAGRGADATQAIIIKVNIPPQVYAGNYAGKILVTAKSGADNSLEIPFNIVISQIDAQTLEIQPIDSSSRKSSEIYRVIVSNQGNAPHIYSLYAEDPNDDIKFVIDPPEVPLRPGEQAALTLKAQPRQRNWVGDDVNHDFKVKMEGSDQEVRGSFKQKAAIAPLHWFGRHWGRFVFFLVLLVILLIAGAILLLALLNKPTFAADCAPVSLRTVNVLSNGTTTNIWVSGRNGAQPSKLEVSEPATKLPGIFASLVSISPDGRRIAYVEADDLAMTNAKIFIKNLDTDQPAFASIPITSGYWPVAPVWSANGEKLAYAVRRPTPVTASGTVTATTPAASGSISGTTATTATTTTAAATTAAEGTPGAAAAANPSQLDLYVVSKIGDAAPEKPLASPTGLVPDLFYGNTLNTVPLCFGSDDASVLINPRTSDGAQVQVSLADGSFKSITPQPGGFQFAKPSIIPNFSGLVMPLKSLVGVPASFLRVPEYQLAAVQQQAGTPGTTTPRTGSGTPGTSTGTTPASNNSNANVCAIAHPFSQNDPRWADIPLKEGSVSTLGELGCPITAAAMLLNYQQVDTNPSDLTSCLGNLTSPLNQTGWFAIGQQCGGFKVEGGVRADFNWDLLDSSLQKGPTIVGLLGGPTGSHFLVITGGYGGVSTSYTVADPWDGSTYKNLDYFLSKGYQPRWIISYDGAGAPCVTTTPDTTNQLGITTTGAQNGGLYQTPQPFRYELTGNTNDTAVANVHVVNARTNLDDNSVTLPPSVTRTFEDEGNYTIAITVKDPSDKTVLVRNIYFTIDHTAPVIGNRLSPTPDKTTNKSVVPVSVSLLATDDLTGIASIEYQINGGQWLAYTSDTARVPLNISDNGTYTINYRATDGAGNTAEAQTINFIIDKPATNINGNGGGRGGTGGTGQVTPTVGPGGGGAGGAGKPTTAALSVPTVTPIPTATPRAARTNTPAPTVAPTTIAPTPTITGTSLLPTGTPEISPSPTAPLPTTEAITPTPTIDLQPVLAVNGAPVTFLPDGSAQQIQIQNNGTAPLIWSISPGASGTLINFSSTAGTIPVGGNSQIDISALNKNLTGIDQNTVFTIKSNGGSQDVGVVIQPQPLPTATLSLVPAATSLNISNTIQINVLLPNANTVPDHIDLYATYKDCVSSCTATATKIGTIDYSGDTTLFGSWDTTTIAPQTGIILGGKICMNQDCSSSNDITNLTGLSIDMSATIDPPSTDNTLPTTTTFKVSSHSERTKKVVITISVDGVQVQQLTADETNAWTQTWDTTNVSPLSTVLIEAQACNSEDTTAICQSIPSLTNYHTFMTGIVGSTPDLSVTKSLTGTISIVVTPTTTNVKSVVVNGFYTKVQNSAQTNQPVNSALSLDSNGTTFTVPILTASWPTQSKVSLTTSICFNSDGTDCVVAGTPYTDLFVPAGDPTVINDLTAQPKYTTIGTAFPNPLSVKITDDNGNPVNGAQVVFTAPNTAGVAGATFTGAGASVIVTTGQAGVDGVATVPLANALVANNFEGTFNVAVTINGFPGLSAIISLNNTTPGAKQMSITGNSDKQVAKIGQKFATPLQVQLDGAGAGITVTFTSQGTGVGATFTGNVSTFQAVTNASGIATAGDLTANPSEMLDSTNYPIVGVHSVSASANGYSPVLFTLTNIVGDPKTISPVVTSTVGVYSIAQSTVVYTTTIDTSYPDIAVQVKDIGGNLLQNTSSQPINVQFTAKTDPQPGVFFNNGTATVSVPTGIGQSANPGVAIATGLKANLKAGLNTVTATVAGYPDVTTSGFSFLNLSGVAASVEISTPTPTSVKGGTAFTGIIQATVFDKGHNTVADSTGAQVKFSSPSISDRSTLGTPSVTFNDTNLSSTAVTVTVAGGSGIAKVTVPVIGTCALGNFQVTATLVGVTANPSAVGLSIVRGDPDHFSVLTGDAQHARINTQFATNLATSLLDACGNTLPNQQVSFSTATTTTQPGGTFNSAGSGVVSVTVTTNASGLATAPALFANLVAVKNTSFNVAASSIAVPSVTTSPTFKLFNDSGIPKFINPTGVGSSSANPLIVTVGTQFTASSGKFLHATVLDEGNNPVFANASTPPNLTKIIFTGNGADPSTGIGAAFDSSTNSTNPDDSGVITSTVPFTTSNKVGTYTVTAVAAASYDGTNFATGTFTMTNTAGAPTQIIPNPSTTSTTPLQATVTIFNTGTSTPFSTLSVKVLDTYSNVISGSSVLFTAKPTLNSANHLATANFGTVPTTNDLTNLTYTGSTDSSGNVTAATVYPGFYSGSYPIIAQTGTISTTFFMKNIPDQVPEAVDITASSSVLTTTVNTAFPKFSAFVTDVNGNGIDGINVTFTIQSVGAAGASWLIDGSGANTKRPTNADGFAVINNDTPNPNSPPVATTDIQANTAAGTFSVEALVDGRTGPITTSIQLINEAERKVTGTSTITFTPPSPTSVAVDQPYGAFTLFVTDQYGNPIGNYPINFAVPSGSGISTGVWSGGGSSKTFNTNTVTGIATVPAGQLTAGTVAGGFAVTANIPVSEGSSTFFAPAPTINLSIVAGVADASHITTSAGSTPVVIVVGQTKATNIVVSVADKYNNPIASPTLSYTISPTPSDSLNAASADATNPMVPAPNTNTAVNTITAITANTHAGSFTIVPHANGVASTSAVQVTNIPDYPANIGVTGGNNQTPEVGQLFATSLQVTVTDQFNNPVGTTNPVGGTNNVVFTAPTSGPSAIFTNTNGVVSNVYTATVNNGTAIVVGGSPNGSVRANNQLNSYNIVPSVPGVTLNPANVQSFTITNTADLKLATTVRQIKNAGGEPFAALQVQVSGAGGTGVPNLPVTFSVSDPAFGVFTSGSCQQLLGPGFNQNGTTTSTTVNTSDGTDSNPAGTASATNYCAGTLVGNYTITATTTIGGVSKSVQVLVANTASLSPTLTNNNQSIVSGGVFNPLGVQVIGYNSNPVPNVEVTYFVTNTTYASLNTATTPVPILSNNGGIAQASYTAGSFVGSYNILATLNSPTGPFTRTFTLTNTVGVAIVSASPTLLAGSSAGNNGQTGQIAAKVQDANGAGLANVNIQFSVASGDTNKVGFSGPSGGLTDSSGLVTVTLQAKTQLGQFTITAAPNGALGSSDTLTGTTYANVTSISAPTPLAGNDTTTITATVKGFNNVNVSGAGVKFSVPSTYSAYGSVPNTTVNSNSSGVVSATLTTGDTAGKYNVLASLDPAQFSPAAVPAIATSGTITPTNKVNLGYVNTVSTLLFAGGVDSNGNDVLGQTASIVFTATGKSGNGVSNVTIAVASNDKTKGYFQGGVESGNVITGTTSPTNSNGNATATLTAGKTLGAYNLTAIGLVGTDQVSTNSLNIGATTTASLSAPSTIVRMQAGGDTQPISVTVTGNSGALVNSATVLFTSGNASTFSNVPASASRTSDATGAASLSATTLSKVGFYTVTATLSGLPVGPAVPTQDISVVNTASIGTISAASPLAGTANVPITATVTGFNSTLIPGASVVFNVPDTTYANFNGNQTYITTTRTTTPNTGIARADLDTQLKAGKYNVKADLDPSQFGGLWNPTTSATIPVTNVVTLSIASNPASPNLLAATNSSANNGATAVITATVVGFNNQAVSNVTVNFDTDAPDKGNVSPTTKDTNGVSKTVTTTLTASNGLGTYNVTAQAFAIGTTDDVGSGPVTQSAKTSANFSGNLAVSNSTPLAGGDSVIVTATVTGKSGQLVEGASVVFTSSDTTKGTISTNTVLTGPDGKAAATVQTGNAVGAYTITAGIPSNPTSLTTNTTLTNTVTVGYNSIATPLAGGGTDTFVVTTNGFTGPIGNIGVAFTGVGGTTAPGGSAVNATTNGSGTATVTVTSNDAGSTSTIYGGWTLRAAAMSGTTNVSNNGTTYNIPVTNTLLITTTDATVASPPRPVANGGTDTLSVQVYGANAGSTVYRPTGVTVTFITTTVSGASLCGNTACGSLPSTGTTGSGGIITPTVTAKTGTTVSPTTAQSYDVQAQINIGGVIASLPTPIRVYNTVKVTATQTGSNLSTTNPLTVTVQDNQNNALSGFNVQFTVMNNAYTAVGSTTNDGYLCINTCVITSSVKYLGIRMATDTNGKAGLNYAQTVQTASTTGSNLDSDYDVIAAGDGDQGANVIATGNNNHVFNIKALVLLPFLPSGESGPSVRFNLQT